MALECRRPGDTVVDGCETGATYKVDVKYLSYSTKSLVYCAHYVLITRHNKCLLNCTMTTSLAVKGSYASESLR